MFEDFFGDSGDLGSVATLSDAEQTAYDNQVLADSQQELQDATLGAYAPDTMQGDMQGPMISPDQLAANEAAYQERLGGEILAQGMGDYQEQLGRDIVASSNAPAPWFSQATGSLGDLMRLGKTVDGLVSDVTGSDKPTVARPQQIFTPRTPSGSTSPNPNFAIFPGRYDGTDGGHGVLGGVYYTGDFSQEAGKGAGTAFQIVGYAVAAVVLGWAVKKWLL